MCEGESYAEVTFAEGSNERFAVPANAYVLNEAGKTIDSFGGAGLPG